MSENGVYGYTPKQTHNVVLKQPSYFYSSISQQAAANYMFGIFLRMTTTNNQHVEFVWPLASKTLVSRSANSIDTFKPVYRTILSPIKTALWTPFFWGVKHASFEPSQNRTSGFTSAEVPKVVWLKAALLLSRRRRAWYKTWLVGSRLPKSPLHPLETSRNRGGRRDETWWNHLFGTI